MMELEPSNNVHCALLCNAYAAVGRWGEVHRVKAIMKERDERFSPGHRLVNLNEIVDEFKIRERQPENQEIYFILDDLVSKLKLDCKEKEKNDF